MKHNRTLWIAGALIVMIMLLGACNLPQSSTPTQVEEGQLQTMAAHTVQVELTRSVEDVQPTIEPPTQAPSETSPPTQPTDTSEPATQEPQATGTPAPTVTATEVPCDHATFVKDVTIPDGTVFDPGEIFTKTWRLRNTGSCTWTTGYSLVFDEGDSMGAPAAQQLTTSSVAPDQEIDISIELTAPDDPGTYRGDFKLRNQSSVVFGLGDESKPFWVEIKVALETGLMLDFIAEASSGDWGSGAGAVQFANPGTTAITFGGPDSDTDGFAMIKDAQKVEGGRVTGKILETHPKWVNDGYIVGKYQPYDVREGDRIKGRIGFILKNDGTCGVGKATFEIHYIIDDDISTRTLLSNWNDTCNGTLITVDRGLSDLEGETVNFFLVVKANGASTQDWAIWDSFGIFRE